MDFIAVTQRVEHLVERAEKRDAIDQSWSELLFDAGFLPLFIPNNKAIASAVLDNFKGKIVGALLTGGNSIQACSGDSLERDNTELFLLDYCEQNELPILGICRGMQLILSKFKGKFRPIDDQIQKQQILNINGQKVMKNSYHNWECIDIPDCFSVFADANSKVVKGVKHNSKNITGIMWHPERLIPFHDDDIELIKEIYQP